MRWASISVAAGLLALSTPGFAGLTAAELAASLKRVAEAEPLTDPFTVFAALGVKTPLEVHLFEDHVDVYAPRDAIEGSPYQSILLMPYAASRRSSRRPNYSVLTISFNRASMCIERADVVGAFGERFTTAPIVATDGAGGTYVGYRISSRHQSPRDVSFSFFWPEGCASDVSIRAAF